MHSKLYNLETLRKIKEINKVREILKKIKNPQIRKAVANKTYMRNHEWNEHISKCNLEDLASCIRKTADSTQTKAYLLWRNKNIPCPLDRKLKPEIRVLLRV